MSRWRVRGSIALEWKMLGKFATHRGSDPTASSPFGGGAMRLAKPGRTAHRSLSGPDYQANFVSVLVIGPYSLDNSKRARGVFEETSPWTMHK
jgi:hypothetical protein